MTSYTADCSDCDFRIAKVPAQDWPLGTMRPLYIYRNQYPSVVTSFRGATWHPNNLQGTPSQLQAWGAESKITGYVPQVVPDDVSIAATIEILCEAMLFSECL